MGNKVAKDTNPLRLALTSQGLIRALGKTPCKGPYHPEEHRLQHTRIVWIRYALSSGFAMAKHSLTQEDLRTLETAVWCHDIGCIHCTQYNETKKSYTAYGHEKVSYEMMESLKEPIEEYGANYDRARWLVLNHMKAHFYAAGIMTKPAKRKALEDHPDFKLLMWLEKMDDMLLDFDGSMHC